MERKLSAMTTALFLLVLFAIALYAVWHSHHTSNPGSWMAGSVSFEDRDSARVRSDLLYR